MKSSSLQILDLAHFRLLAVKMPAAELTTWRAVTFCLYLHRRDNTSHQSKSRKDCFFFFNSSCYADVLGLWIAVISHFPTVGIWCFLVVTWNYVHVSLLLPSLESWCVLSVSVWSFCTVLILCFCCSSEMLSSCVYMGLKQMQLIQKFHLVYLKKVVLINKIKGEKTTNKKTQRVLYFQHCYIMKIRLK